MGLKHRNLTVVPDDGTSPVGSDEWNTTHLLEKTPTETVVVPTDHAMVVVGPYHLGSGVQLDIQGNARVVIL